jgi:deoxyribose-phosphate aldolase
MRKHLADTIKIKANGGIRTFALAKELIDAGADRIGSSNSMVILAESKL